MCACSVQCVHRSGGWTNVFVAMSKWPANNLSAFLIASRFGKRITASTGYCSSRVTDRPYFECCFKVFPFFCFEELFFLNKVHKNSKFTININVVLVVTHQSYCQWLLLESMFGSSVIVIVLIVSSLLLHVFDEEKIACIHCRGVKYQNENEIKQRNYMYLKQGGEQQ